MRRISFCIFLKQNVINELNLIKNILFGTLKSKSTNLFHQTRTALIDTPTSIFTVPQSHSLRTTFKLALFSFIHSLLLFMLVLSFVQAFKLYLHKTDYIIRGHSLLPLANQQTPCFRQFDQIFQKDLLKLIKKNENAICVVQLRCLHSELYIFMNFPVQPAVTHGAADF